MLLRNAITVQNIVSDDECIEDTSTYQRLVRLQADDDSVDDDEREYKDAEGEALDDGPD